MSDLSTHELLVKAREIQARGHCKGRYRDETGAHCMMGSLIAARNEGPPSTRRWRTYDAVLDALDFHTIGSPLGYADICNWSDAHTLEEVLARFDAGIEATA